MTDRELLELAAKAAGITDATWNERLACVETLSLPGFDCYWNPLKDDGHALRLAAKLNIDLEFTDSFCFAIWYDMDKSETHKVKVSYSEYLESEGGKYPATRRAITRAAAEIGRAMP